MPALEEEGGTLNSIISVNKNILIMIVDWRGHKKMSEEETEPRCQVKCEIFVIKEHLWKYHPSIIIGLTNCHIKIQKTPTNISKQCKNLPQEFATKRFFNSQRTINWIDL